MKDLLGINKLIGYRTFVRFNWTQVNPMFNVMEVEPGQENLFITFLIKANRFSSKVNSPVSVGPYQVDGQGIFIYTTHYGSVWRFLQVMNGMLFKGLSNMRAKATKTTGWTYCINENSEQLAGLDKVYLLGIKGDPTHFLEAIKNAQVQVASSNRMVKNVRGEVFGDYYYIFARTPKIYNAIQTYAAKGGRLVLYKASRIPSTIPNT